MTDGIIQIAPDSTGKKVDTSELTVGANTVERQRTVIADDATAAAVAKVQATQPGSSDYGLTVRQAGDGYVVLNAYAWSAAAVLWSGATDGYNSFNLQITGTFSATLVVEESNDNANWAQVFVTDSTSTPATGYASSLTSAKTHSYGQIRAKYIRVRCSTFASNTSGIVTFVLRAGPHIPDYVSVAIATANPIFYTSPAATPPTAGIGSTAFLKSAASTNATSVKASAGNIYGLFVTNNSAAVKYLKLYNKASAPTVGTDTPVAVIGIAANGGQVAINHVWSIPRFSTGIAYAITGGVSDADTTAVSANDVSGWIVYG